MTVQCIQTEKDNDGTLQPILIYHRFTNLSPFYHFWKDCEPDILIFVHEAPYLYLLPKLATIRILEVYVTVLKITNIKLSNFSGIL